MTREEHISNLELIGCDGWTVTTKAKESLEWAISELKENKGENRPKGEWNVVSDGYGNNAYICECSECKDTVWVYKDADRTWNYCPNCGADMRGKAE